MIENPIGMMDSGVGGLTVLKVGKNILPNEDFIYIGDEARVPYGPREPQQVLQFTNQMADFLLKQQVKAIVIACNTASAVGADELEEQLDIPVIGMIKPGATSAVNTTKNGRIGIIATEGTVKSHVYTNMILENNSSLRVQEQACQEFVSLVENNELSGRRVESIVHDSLASFKESGIDTLVLGCTHFPLLRDVIQEEVGSQVQLVDPGLEAMKIMRSYLAEDDELQTQNVTAKISLNTTANQVSFTKIADQVISGSKQINTVKLG
ncbi:glutamate racemase [Pediococcus claussenii]|uniref:Glutamate racemase n=1 Tax=Pediococcus claussenii (strain ATCC BAA-344 / DSM 14800 / JCM 18046 / KCTC 3811 / LMG 21948 / P06) TaxID=701521 RepID=G8PCN5_PEDCP|nr:glutamate racemase [Pediococcus claussenii]AEV95020.1 glutamate racemase [Pediococcus claussenii ATCC BAA-344]ANZ70209.1 glutamate racemase [Pediococcus claussenii]ANZ72025.1 glutamate racemase [Pediococcus claussenii]KRN19178.1 murI protein [Pediococcus claussenii]